MRTFFSIIILLTVSGCMKQIAYGPQMVESFHSRPENFRLDFRTVKGEQTAFYIPPLNSPEKPPRKIAILYPGIKSVALGWLKFIEPAEDPATAYLLIDYPGRGFCEGFMHPEKNYLNSEGALRTLAKHFGLDSLDAELNLMGHSFGSGAALQFAARRDVKRIILVAPFNTLRQAVSMRSFLLAILMPSQIDNRKLIKELLTRENQPKIVILHGAKDPTLPVNMGRELASLDNGIEYHEFPEDGHVSILDKRRDLIFRKLNGLTE